MPTTRSPWSILLPVAGVCLLLAVLETLQQHAGNELRNASIAFSYTAISSMVPWIAFILLLPLILWLAGRFPVDQHTWRRALPIHLLALFAIASVHIAVTVETYRLLTPSSTPFWLYWFKIFTFRFATDFALYGAVLGVVHARRASESAREREQAALKLEASLAEARLSALREQLQPHFLFNTLNAMSTLALRGDSESVTRGLTVLSDLLRFTLETQRTQEVPLAEELAFIDQYLELMMLRFGDRLTVIREIDDHALDAAVPVMLMQPLVENAIRHGIAETPGPGTLRIMVSRTDDELRVELQDSGPGFREAARRDGIGLSNTRARLAALHGSKATMDCGTVNGRGGLVRVMLPYRALPLPTPVPA